MTTTEHGGELWRFIWCPSKYPPMHVQTAQNTNAHETTRKIKKISKCVTCEQVAKTQKRGKQHQNSKKKSTKENKKTKTEQETQHAASIHQSRINNVADRKNNKLRGTGNF